MYYSRRTSLGQHAMRERGAEVVCRQLVAHLVDGTLEGVLNRAALESWPQPETDEGPDMGSDRVHATCRAGDRCRSRLLPSAGLRRFRLPARSRAARVDLSPRSRRCPGVSISTPVTAGGRFRLRARSAGRGRDRRRSDVAAVTAASMREGFVLYDEDGHEIWACPNIDARAGTEATEMIAEGLAERQYRRGGDWTSITAPARLRWIRRASTGSPRASTPSDRCSATGYRPSLAVSSAPIPRSAPRPTSLIWRARTWSPETARELASSRPAAPGRSKPARSLAGSPRRQRRTRDYSGHCRRRRRSGHAACAPRGGFTRVSASPPLEAPSGRAQQSRTIRSSIPAIRLRTSATSSPARG